jgi:DNA replication and repair protein RecF
VLCFCHFIFGAAKITILIAQFTHLKVQKLSLVFFKNHNDLSLEMEEVTAIAGLNGVGKTSVLDAIHFLCLGKSYFSSTDVQCIQTGQLQSGILAEIENKDKFHLKVKLKRGGRKIIEKNSIPYKHLSEHIGQFLAVVIAPNDIELIYGTNDKRRSFTNQIISQINHEHLKTLVKYNKLIEHRNKHLKEDTVDLTLIQTLDEQIGPLAQNIFEARTRFFEEFSSYFNLKYHQLSDNKEHIKLIYKSQLSKNTYTELVNINRTKDIAIRRSSSGTHKDEIEIELDNFSLKKYGSQGQIKSGLIALKLAEFEYLKDKKEWTPILLLDDIFEKIDEERSKVLTEIIKNGNFGQIFITDTNSSRLKSFCEEIGKPFKTITLD